MDGILGKKLREDLKEALRAKEVVRLSTIRMLISAISNKEIATQKKDVGLSDEEILGVISQEVKRRRDAIVEYRKGMREELAVKEEGELEILSKYLPPEISDEEIEKAVQEVVDEIGVEGENDFGKTMKAVMSKLKGRASGDRVSKIVQQALRK
jgi:uncharacterized protein